MAEEKHPLVKSDAAFRDKLREWVRLSFTYYDKNPAAVKYILAMPLVAYSSGHSKVLGQSELMIEMIQRAADAGEIREIKAEMALSHLTGIMLNVPRLIYEGTLEGTVLDYIDEVAETAWRILRPDGE